MSCPENEVYLSNFSDEQIEEMEKRLADNQRAIYQRLLGELRDKRHALFLATSYPMEIKEGEK